MAATAAIFHVARAPPMYSHTRNGNSATTATASCAPRSPRRSISAGKERSQTENSAKHTIAPSTIRSPCESCSATSRAKSPCRMIVSTPAQESKRPKICAMLNRCLWSTAPSNTISTGMVEFISCALDAVVECRPEYTSKLKATIPARDDPTICQRRSQYRFMSRRMVAQPNGSRNTNATRCLAKANIIGGTSPRAALPTTKLPAQKSGGRISTNQPRSCVLLRFARRLAFRSSFSDTSTETRALRLLQAMNSSISAFTDCVLRRNRANLRNLIASIVRTC